MGCQGKRLPDASSEELFCLCFLLRLTLLLRVPEKPSGSMALLDRRESYNNIPPTCFRQPGFFRPSAFASLWSSLNLRSALMFVIPLVHMEVEDSAGLLYMVYTSRSPPLVAWSLRAYDLS